jgi:pyruvate dehydrogenase E2 component (dihydrolipoamide acetyltransferase)
MAETITMPKLGFDMAEGTLVRWLIAEGEPVEKGQVLAEIETDKATVEVESTASGVVYRQIVAEGSAVPVGDPIAIIAAPGEEVKAEIPVSTPESATSEIEVEEKLEQPTTDRQKDQTTADEGRIKASPLAKRMAADANINLAEIKGSGPGGRVVKSDVEKALETTESPGMKPGPAERFPDSSRATPLPAWQPGAAPQPDQRVPVDRLRSIIAKRMQESKQQVPHFYITGDINAEPLMLFRKQANIFLPEEEKLSINDIIIKAAALVLRQFPYINASLDGNEIVIHGRVNVGVAVALDAGLLTVVCKDADQKPLRLISKEVKEMAARARQGKVRPDDIEGSTFSISNLGMYDVDEFSAIINPPEAAILAVASVKEVAVVENDSIRVGLQMKATLSADHRITDGAEAARFMQALAEILENPVGTII